MPHQCSISLGNSNLQSVYENFEKKVNQLNIIIYGINETCKFTFSTQKLYFNFITFRFRQCSNLTCLFVQQEISQLRSHLHLRYFYHNFHIHKCHITKSIVFLILNFISTLDPLLLVSSCSNFLLYLIFYIFVFQLKLLKCT